MIPLRIVFNDGALSDLLPRERRSGRLTAVAGLEAGTVSGKPTTYVVVELDDGTVVIGETTWALLHAACNGLEARYGAPT